MHEKGVLDTGSHETRIYKTRIYTTGMLLASSGIHAKRPDTHFEHPAVSVESHWQLTR